MTTRKESEDLSPEVDLNKQREKAEAAEGAAAAAKDETARVYWERVAKSLKQAIKSLKDDTAPAAD